MLFILWEVGIKKINRNAANVDAPGTETDIASGDFHGTNDGFVLFIQHRLNRKIRRVKQIVELGLPVVCIDGLLKISFAVKQADADKSQAQIARGFGVVSCENSETARGDRQRFVETKFRGKIRGRFFLKVRSILLCPGG